MHALILQGNGQYYLSYVFGYYRDSDTENVYDGGRTRYWIVWNRNRKRLIRWYDLVQGSPYLILQTLIVDSDQSNWNKDDSDYGYGCVDFLSKDLLDSIVDAEEQPEDILARCRAIDEGYVYNDVQEIRTQKDIDDLWWASGGFHDAYIKSKEFEEDGTLHVLITGTWSCHIEMWFCGDAACDEDTTDPDFFDSYGWGSTVVLQDGFIYFVEDDDRVEDKVNDARWYFKARHMRYKVIPRY